jgi:hypothetical protein
VEGGEVVDGWWVRVYGEAYRYSIISMRVIDYIAKGVLKLQHFCKLRTTGCFMFGLFDCDVVSAIGGMVSLRVPRDRTCDLLG